MNRRRMVVMVALGALLTLGIGAQVWAQQDRGDRGGRRGRFDPSRMQAMFLERLKTTLNPTEDEWTVIKPRLEKVMTLSMQNRMRGMRFGRGRRRGPGGEAAENADEATRQMSPLETASEALRTALENEKSTPEELKAKLVALRDAREKAREELAQARESLREILTQRQEAQLVLMDFLD